MTGRIKMYNEQKGFGFIIGDDGKDRFFHISNVKSVDLPSIGLLVEFESQENGKGLMAANVNVKAKTEKKHGTFIQFGDVRVKLSNVKNYGISQDYYQYEKVFRVWYNESTSKLGKLFNIKYEFDWEFADKYERLYCNSEREKKIKAGECYSYVYAEKDQAYSYEGNNLIFAKEPGIYKSNIRRSCLGDIVDLPEDYLYVTTYQGDNYKFRVNNGDFDIYKKLEELDSALCN
ncbi:MAG: cold shock domain-containing protein [Sedimentibacter saalensis]|uniref:cold-shock protein n=1 Tax=Sedimentibacter saalensis TaxID=130788 RepID=UPI002B1F9D38|nr:cold shock domain-containing protein [Sedimentibacter saalensis]MEA5093498.1 cold shock domain-containing protein [Sedimentibacter saalensis]